MNIVMTVHHELDPNAGAPGVTLRLAEAYREMGHTVEIVSLCQMPREWSELSKSVAFPAFVARRIAQACRRGRVDVVDASTGDAWLWALRAPRRRPTLVTRSHGLEHTAHESRMQEARAGRLSLSWKYPLYRGGLHLKEVAWSLRCADLALLLNASDAQYAVEELGVEEGRAAVVHNGVHATFLGLPPPPPSRRTAPPRVAMVGSWMSHKGSAFASEALAAFLGRRADASVSLFGTGKSEDEVLSDFPDEVRPQVEVVPRYAQERLPSMLQGHQVLLFPSLAEGFGIGIVEGMACGLAPVVTAVSGPLEIVTDRVNGWVVPPRDSSALDRALESAFEDRVALDAMRRAAHSRAQEFEWGRIASDQIDKYKKVKERAL